ncbi:hypothetical protein [Priestia sp. GS2]|uniref:hypothetical protein n=1 Tax=Priestia sp. GS2 TaxID=3117403 RepID=UPI002EDA1447
MSTVSLHITYYDDENDNLIEAIGYKMNKGCGHFLKYCSEDDVRMFDAFSMKNSDYPLLFTVKLRTEAEEKCNEFVEIVILKRKKD